MDSFFRFFAKRHMLANLFFIMILVLGTQTLLDINRSRYPEVDLGEMYIITRYPGASPEDVELNVTNKIEDELKGISGIESVSSVSMENISNISVVLDPDASDPDEVKTEIKDAVDRVTDLPDDVLEAPQVKDIKTSILPIIEVGIAGDMPYAELRELVRRLEKKLKTIRGVASIDKWGYRAREIQIEVSHDKLKEYQLPLHLIVNAIKSRNVRATAGSLESYTSEKNIVTLAQFRNPADVGNVIVRSSYSGPLITVRDLAVVKDDFADEAIFPRIKGKKAISLLIHKSENADIITTVDEVKALTEEFREKVDEKVVISYVSDLSKNVRNQFDIVRSNGIVGLILVLIVLTIFLNIRNAIWVASGIPITILGVIFLLPYFNVDLDSITLSAFIIVIGIIVDDAIIISENIYQRRERGDSPLDAAVNGISEVFLPVLTTILTTFLAFAPLFFMTGVLGKFIYVIPLTISLALLVSFVEVIIALPAHLIPGLKKIEPADRDGKKESTSWFEPLKILFEKFSFYVLKLRYILVILALLCLILTIYYATSSMDFVLFPSEGATTINVNVELPIGNSLEATSDKVREIEAIFGKLPDDELESYVIRIGMAGDWNATQKPNSARFTVDLTPYASRSRTANQIVDALRDETNKLEGFDKIAYEVEVGGPPTGRPITIRVVGSDDELRKILTDDVLKFLNTIKGAKDIESDDKPGKDQIEVIIDYKQLARVGLAVDDISRNLRIAYDGELVTSVRYGEEDVDFRVVLGQKYRKSLKALKELNIPNRDGRLIPLKDVAKLNIGPGPSNYRHYDGERTITVTGDVDQDVTTPIEVTRTVIDHFNVDQDYGGMRLVVGGEAEELQEAMTDLALLFAIALLGIYFLLILLFDSIVQPLLVLIAVPFGLIGIVITFALHGEPLSFLAMTGIVGLAGVVVNDSLVLVSHINDLRKSNPDAPIIKVVAEGSANRLRAILITTISTVAGLLPLAYGIGGSDVFMAPMALALGYGLVFATPLTLLLIPALYVIGDDISRVISFIARRGKK